MPTYLNLSDLSRRELEDMLLTVHSAYTRSLKAVRECCAPGWKVRQSVEAIASEVRDRRVFTRAFARLGETRNADRERARNAAFWDGLTPPPHPPATPP